MSSIGMIWILFFYLTILDIGAALPHLLNSPLLPFQYDRALVDDLACQDCHLVLVARDFIQYAGCITPIRSDQDLPFACGLDDAVFSELIQYAARAAFGDSSFLRDAPDSYRPALVDRRHDRHFRLYPIETLIQVDHIAFPDGDDMLSGY